MKKILFSFALLFSGIACVMAGKGINTSRLVKIAAPFSRLIIEGNVEVILVSNTSGLIAIDGSAADVSDVTIKNHNGRLVIAAKQQGNGEKITIRVPFQQLKEIGMYGDVDLRSADVLKTGDLKVYIDGACRVALKVEGTVRVTHSDACEIKQYQKQPA